MSVLPPEPDDLSQRLRGARSSAMDRMLDRPFNQAEYEHYNSPDVQAMEYGFTDDTYEGMQGIMGGGTPFQNMPPVESRREMYETISYSEELQGNGQFEADDPSYPSYGPGRGYHYRNLAENPTPFRTPDQQPGGPSFATEIPTSTTNPERPRTVGAGYDKSRQCLTVIFRDGTYYNYYDVSGLEWANFKRARSKGRYIYTHLDQKPRGAADVASLPAEARDALWQVARVAQVRLGGRTGTHSATSKRGGRGSYSKGNLGGTGRKRRKAQ